MNRWWAFSCLMLLACAPAKPPELPLGAPEGVAAHTVPVFGWAGTFICSAVVIAEHTVLTAAHCVGAAHTVGDARARIVTVDYPLGAWHDVAILQTAESLQTPPATIGLTRTPYVWVAGYGCPKQHDRIAVRQLYVLTGQYVQGVICPGDSGAPVVSDRGELVGIATAFFRSNDGASGGVVEWIN